MGEKDAGRHWLAGFALAAAMLLVAACGVGLVIGSGNSVTEERAIENVQGVVLSFVGDLRVTQGDEEKLVITADDNVMPLITTEVRDGVLTIGCKSTVGLQATTKLHYDLTVRDLNSIRLTGAGNASIWLWSVAASGTRTLPPLPHWRAPLLSMRCA